MKNIAYFLSIFMLAHFSRAEVPPKNKIKAQVTSDKAIILWDSVENVTEYYVELNSGESKSVSGTQALFSNLTATTAYTATVYISDPLLGPQYLYGTYDFKTLLAPATNLTILNADENSIHLTWNERYDAIGYSVVVKDSDHNLIFPTVNVQKNKGTITELEPAHLYYIYVIVLGSGVESAPAVVSARTDGTGVKVTLWNGGQGGFLGGEVVVYRPLVIPIGPYTVKVNFGCPLESVKVWNAQFDKEASDLLTGMVVAHQRVQWQKQKSMIMMNFYPSINGSYCEISNTSVTALFGDDAKDAANIDDGPTVNTDVGALVYEWLQNPMKPVKSAGLIQIMLKDTYNSTNDLEAENSKPDEGEYIIVINCGDDCPGGINVTSIWGMKQKSSAGMVGATPQTKYFVQAGNDWYSNEPGLIYGYDPKNCPNRQYISAQVMVGGPFVRAVVYAPDQETGA